MCGNLLKGLEISSPAEYSKWLEGLKAKSEQMKQSDEDVDIEVHEFVIPVNDNITIQINIINSCECEDDFDEEDDFEDEEFNEDEINEEVRQNYILGKINNIQDTITELSENKRNLDKQIEDQRAVLSELKKEWMGKK